MDFGKMVTELMKAGYKRAGARRKTFIWRLHSFPVYATMLLQIYKEGLCKLHEQKWLGQGYLPN